MIRTLLALAFALGSCTWAGYRIGLAVGRGWRGAMIEGHCQLLCLPPQGRR